MEKLNSDELLEVFEFLNGSDLEHAADVCKSWNYLISSSTKLMKRLYRVDIDRSDSTSLQNAVEKFKKLPYRKLLLSNLTKENFVKIKDIFKAHGRHIDYLVVSYIQADDLIWLLPSFPNLTHLYLATLSCLSGSSQDLKVDLKHLKKLNVIGPSEFIKHIGSHQIEELECEYSSMIAKEIWKDFLLSCNNLKKLKLNDSWFHSLKLADLNLQLTELEFIANDRTAFPDELKDFLKSQKETLRILSMAGQSTELEEIHGWYNGILELAVLEVQLDEFNYNINIIVGMEHQLLNNSIKKLSLYISLFNDDTLEYYRNVISGLQAVEHLKIKISTYDYEEDSQRGGLSKDLKAVQVFKLLTFSMPKLKLLNLECDEGLKSAAVDELNKLRIEQVETLETNLCCRFLQTEERLLYISKKSAPLIFCPNIRKLKLGTWNEISTEHLEIMIQTLKNVEEIYAYEIELNEKIVDLILNSKIRKIELKVMPELPEKLKYSKIFKKGMIK